MDGEARRRRVIEWQDPVATAETGRGMSGLEYLERIRDGELPAPPIAALVGFTLAEVVPGRVVYECAPGEFHYNPLGSVHGGIAATLLDSAMGCAIHATLPKGRFYTTVELKVNYVRAITAATGPIRAIGEVIHPGRQIATAEGKLVDGAGKLYCHATTTCLVFDLPPAR
jgi:uncharacterized protein (TIGR00369 family)